MSVAWIPELPSPDITYSYTNNDNLAKLEFEAGNIRAFRKYTIAPDTFSFKFVLSGSQYQLWIAWWRDILNQGSEHITDMPFPSGNGMNATDSGYIIGTYHVAHVEHDTYELTFQAIKQSSEVVLSLATFSATDKRIYVMAEGFSDYITEAGNNIPGWFLSNEFGKMSNGDKPYTLHGA